MLEVALRDTDADALLGAWRARVTELGRRLGWDALAPVVRRHAEGAALFIAAPLDGLMTATDVNEQAWVLAESGGYAPPAAAVVHSWPRRPRRSARRGPCWPPSWARPMRGA